MDGTQFNGVIAAAANIPANNENGIYTVEMFMEDFPQFSKAGMKPRVPLVPEGILGIFIGNANRSILPSRYFETWRYAAGLYVAHFSALYLKTYSDGSATAAQAAGSGQQTGLISEASMGDTSVKYDNVIHGKMGKLECDTIRTAAYFHGAYDWNGRNVCYLIIRYLEDGIRIHLTYTV